MPLYRYIKKRTRSRLKLPPYFSYLLIVCGLVSLGWAIWPIASFQLLSARAFTRIITPVSDPGIGGQDKSDGGIEAGGYTNPNLWFPNRPQKKVVTPVNSYLISIPKLRISNALVVIAGDNLKDSLIHYGGTALPGEYGNTVIFGHSTLPQLYDPLNYTSIFSLLPTLKPARSPDPGDDIFLTYDGISYHYVVTDMHITKPDDLSPLEQRFDDSYVTLITCVPPGTYWERLNVTARLKPI